MRMPQTTEQTKTQSSASHLPTRRCFGLLVRRERWGLSWPARLVLILVSCLGCIGLLRGAYPFLAISQTVSTDTLIVEGWLPPSMATKLATRYAAQKYHKIVV